MKISNTKIGYEQSKIDANDKRVDGNIFWALRNVHLQVRRGEVLGIIGKNGAGKSTFLKILSHITTPTSGKIKIKGSFASLLEVGSGFHPDLTGRENIYLNGAILGLTKHEIKAHLESIVEFSGIQHHIDSPVKRYSSGMKVRLGFAVAAHLNPDILIIDEVLAVGDAEFQAKCLGKIGEVTESGRTVLFVSHNMAAVRSLCTSAIWIDEGKICVTGGTNTVIEQYIAPSTRKIGLGKMEWPSHTGPGGEEVKLLSVIINTQENAINDLFYTSLPIKVEIKYGVYEKLWGSRILIQIKDILDVTVFTSTSQFDDPEIKLPGIYITTCTIQPNLLNAGLYKLFVYMDIPHKKQLIRLIHVLTFNTVAMGYLGSLEERWEGIVAPQLNWKTIQLS
ncbi:MAG TPA: ABC transporter ATP-binding protein [Bacteroidia bacterium]|nr:ABC transporter ATP-binding protein [Bacteroidia bacterium]